MLKILVWSFTLLIAGNFSIFAQAAPPNESVSLEDILLRADTEAKNYAEVFKDLSTEETKTFEFYDKNGKSKDRRTVKSLFIIYQSTKDANQIAEYRNVSEVDGRRIADGDRRAEQFFSEIVRAESAKRELDKLNAESLRFDKGVLISGLTRSKAIVLAENLRPFFEFKIAREDEIDGRRFYVVEYTQTRKTPFVRVNSGEADNDNTNFDFDVEISGALKELNERLRGRLWIDKETFQTRREQQELTIQPPEAKSPAPVQQTDFEYQPSEFGILTPKQISYLQYRAKIAKSGEVSAAKNVRVLFEYGKFSKPDVEVKSGEVK